MEQLRQVEILISEARNFFDGEKSIPKPAKYALGTFHGWEDFKDEYSSRRYAIVELDENGKVGRYEVDQIRFTGLPAGANMFKEGIKID